MRRPFCAFPVGSAVYLFFFVVLTRTSLPCHALTTDVWEEIDTSTSSSSSFSFDTSFREELLLRPLKEGDTVAHWHFTTLLPPSHDSGVHYSLFPKTLGQLVRKYNVEELHLTFTQGRWQEHKWGPPLVSAPVGAQLWAYLSPIPSTSVDEQWKGLTHALSGLFCASLNLMDVKNTCEPRFAFVPESLNVSSDNVKLRYSSLPREPACTENLTPWSKLLPCRTKAGLAALWDPLKSAAGHFRSIAAHVRPVCISSSQKDNECESVQLELTQTITVVIDSSLHHLHYNPNKWEWHLSSLFEINKITSWKACPLAASSSVYLDLSHLDAINRNFTLIPPPSYFYNSVDGSLSSVLSPTAAEEDEEKAEPDEEVQEDEEKEETIDTWFVAFNSSTLHNSQNVFNLRILWSDPPLEEVEQQSEQRQDEPSEEEEEESKPLFRNLRDVLRRTNEDDKQKEESKEENEDTDAPSKEDVTETVQKEVGVAPSTEEASYQPIVSTDEKKEQEHEPENQVIQKEEEIAQPQQEESQQKRDQQNGQAAQQVLAEKEEQEKGEQGEKLNEDKERTENEHRPEQQETGQVETKVSEQSTENKEEQELTKPKQEQEPDQQNVTEKKEEQNEKESGNEEDGEQEQDLLPQAPPPSSTISCSEIHHPSHSLRDRVTARRYLTEGTEPESEGLNVDLVNERSHPVLVTYFSTVPWYLRLYFHTFSLAVNGTPVDRPLQELQEFSFIPGEDRGSPAIIEATMSIPPRTVLILSFDFEKAFLHFTEFPPDPHRGFDIGTAVLRVHSSPSNSSSIIIPSSARPLLRDVPVLPSSSAFLASFAQHGKNEYHYTNGLLVDLPTPDFSMPYNVITFTGAAMAIFFGSMFKLLLFTRRNARLALEAAIRGEDDTWAGRARQLGQRVYALLLRLLLVLLRRQKKEKKE
ncbi:GPI transamidase component PIG-T [Balamuthia mandrillaris]